LRENDIQRRVEKLTDRMFAQVEVELGDKPHRNPLVLRNW
jgi:hypothetical protein